MKKRRPSASLVLALIAVILACAGSATAASVITGKQIRNGSVTGADIRDGSIGLRDLAAAARNTARATTGSAGAAGPAGAAGRDGRDGVAGAVGRDGTNGAAGAAGGPGLSGYEIVHGDHVVAPNGGGNQYRASATCPEGKVPIGGGGGSHTWGGSAGQRVGEVITSIPSPDDRRWFVIFAKGDMATVTVDAYVICAKVAA